MFKYNSLIKTSLESISRNKSRSLLTTLGVIIGVLSVILLTSIGNGIRGFVNNQFESMGSNIIYVMPGEIITEEGSFSQSSDSAIASSKLKEEDADSINRIGSPVGKAAPLLQGPGELRYGAKKRSVEIWGSSSLFNEVMTVKIAKGHFFTKAEEDAKKKVVIITPKIVEKLFGNEDPLNKEITINKTKFKVIGVTEQGDSGLSMGGTDNIAYVPISSAKSYLGLNVVTSIIVTATSKDNISDAIRLIDKTMGKRLDSKDYSVLDQRKLLSTVDTILSVLTAGLTGIAAISLLVGGIGIMNIMLVSVTERTKEIGLRKALGATPGVIMLQFLIEAATLSSLGGIIGIVLATLITLVIRKFIPAAVTLDSVILAFGVSFGIGVIFGVLPARRASRLSPIEALRYE
jgi:putative ABC transport system permease protein